MIITRFKSENILKYANLSLESLPERGLIGIEGPNEAGKSAIAESICLGLFGRTFAYPEGDFLKAVKWGAAAASVELSFKLPSGDEYTASRFFDLDGQHSARLTKNDDDEPIAQGPEQVTARVEELTKVNFQQYIDAFYLAQREFSIPNAQSDMLKSLLGIADMDKVAERIQWELDDNTQQIRDLHDQIDQANTTLASLDIEDATLDAAEAKQSGAIDQAELAQQALTDGEQRSERVHTHLAGLISVLADAAEINADDDYAKWSACQSALAHHLDVLRDAIDQQPALDSVDLEPAHGFAEDFSAYLAAYRRIRDQAGERVTEWTGWLEEGDCSEDPGDPPRYHCALANVYARLPRFKGIRARNWLFGLLASLGGGVAASAAVMQRHAPDHSQWQALLELAARQSFPLSEWAQHALTLPVGAGVGVFGLLLLIRAIWAGKKLGSLNDEIRRLDRRADLARSEIRRIEKLDELSLREECESLAQLSDDAIVDALARFEDKEGKTLLHDDRWAMFVDPVHAIRDELVGCEARTTDRLSDMHAQAQSKLEVAELAQQETEQALAHVLGEREQAEQLKREIRDAEAALYEPKDQIKVREYALKLIHGAGRRIYTRFNQQMRDYLGKLLPLFTEGRYQHLKIDDDFSVQVFSADKNDFVNLDDLSSGTQRQLILAIRLAMSQALVDSRIHGPQMLILDEPFAFFDRERMEQTLATLPSFSPDICQVWVISQEFDDDAGFDLRITADRSDDKIAIKG